MNRYDQRMQELGAEFMSARSGHKPIHVTEEEFEVVERVLGERLPDDYREFVRDYGNYWISAIFSLRVDSEEVLGGVAHFSGIIGQQYQIAASNRAWTDIIGSYYNLQPDPDWPQQWLPIASGDGSDFYVMEFRGENKGSIHYIVDASLQPTFKIADSFDQFIWSVRKLEDEDWA